MKFWHPSIILILSASIAQATTVIYDGSSADLNIINNDANNDAVAVNTLSGGAGALCLENPHGTNNNSGFASMDNIDTLLGRSRAGVDLVRHTSLHDGGR